MFVKRFSGAIVILGLMLFMIAACAINVKAQESLNSMWVSPSSVYFDQSNGTLGTKFNVTVWANMDNATFTWQVRLNFNATILEATNAGFTGSGRSLFFASHALAIPITPVLNNAIGFIGAGETLTGTDYGVPTNSSLMWAEFQIIAVPNETNPVLNGSINLNNNLSYFANVSGIKMVTVKSDALYQNIVPEFTSVLMIVMLVATASAVLLTRKKIKR